MKNHKLPARITLWVNRGVGILIGILLFTLPLILDWYANFRDLGEIGQWVVTVAFYCCAVVIAVALWNMDVMLRAILRDEVFVSDNVRRLRTLRLCCGLVSLICLIAGVAYPPVMFIAIIMGFLCLTVSVVASVMDAAVALREENDLTI
ncbi:MAG: DUF2975 domain-containing protein [Oscillospiraceae bacterium]|nr:DUF2975 domain-containing protein [Oscillospiraceae bacterium]